MTLALRVFVGRRQAVVSARHQRPTYAARRARRWPWRGSRPKIPFAGSPIRTSSRGEIPELDLLDRICQPSPSWKSAPSARERGACGQGRDQVGRRLGVGPASAGMVLVTSGGFRGAYPLLRAEALSMTAIAQGSWHWSATTDYSSTLNHGADLGTAGEGRRSAGERTVERASIRARSTPKRVPVVFDRRVAGSLVSHLRQRHQRLFGCPQDQLPQGQARQQLFRRGISIVDDPRRRRGLRSRPFDAEGVANQSRSPSSRTGC